MKTNVVITALKAAEPQSHRPQAMTGQVKIVLRPFPRVDGELDGEAAAVPCEAVLLGAIGEVDMSVSLRVRSIICPRGSLQKSSGDFVWNLSAGMGGPWGCCGSAFARG